MNEHGIKCKGCGKPAPTQEPGVWSDLCRWCASQATKAQAERDDAAIKASGCAHPPAVWGPCSYCHGDGIARQAPGFFSFGGPQACYACAGSGDVVGHLDADAKFFAGPPGGKVTWKERYAQALKARGDGMVKTPLYDEKKP